MEPPPEPAPLSPLRQRMFDPSTLASWSLGAVLADMSLYPLTSVAGLRELGQVSWGEVARSVGSVAFAAVIPLVLVHRATFASTTRGAVGNLVVAGLGYGVVSGFVGVVLLGLILPQGIDMSLLPRLVWMPAAWQAAALPLALAGMVLAMGRPAATLDRRHRAAFSAGAWLLWLGGLIHWTSFGSSVRVELRLDPRTWSIPLVLVGAWLLWRGVQADRALAASLAEVREGRREGWRIAPPDADITTLPAPLYEDSTELDGALTDPDGVAVARVYQELSDEPRRLRRRAMRVILGPTLSVLAVCAATLAWLFWMLPGRW